MNTYNFWKFAEYTKEEEKLSSIFDKFVTKNKISSFDKEYLWKSINKDVENSFKKTAAASDNMTNVVKTTIKTLLDSLIDGGIISQNSEQEEVETAVKDTAPEISSEDIKSEISDKPKQESEESSSDEMEQTPGEGTIFQNL